MTKNVFATSQIFKKSCNAKISVYRGIESYEHLSLSGNRDPFWSVNVWGNLARTGKYSIF